MKWYEVTIEESDLSSRKTAFTWSTEPPTEEGWYWIRFPDKKTEMVKIGAMRDIRAVEFADVWNLEIVTHWLGPIPEPEPPQ